MLSVHFTEYLYRYLVGLGVVDGVYMAVRRTIERKIKFAKVTINWKTRCVKRRSDKRTDDMTCSYNNNSTRALKYII